LKETMASKELFQPKWTSSPGETISDILKEKRLSLIEFAEHMEHTPEDINDLLQGRSTITIAIARRLEKVLGASMEFWISRDFQYREDIKKFQKTEKEWLRQLPIGDMIKFRWLIPIPHPSNEINACLHFFDVPNISAWQKKYANLQKIAVFRTSPSFDSRLAAVATWLRQGEVVGSAINCNSWNAKQFLESLSRIRSLTKEKNPSQFIPKLQSYCAECGVAVAIVRAPSGCRASGATRFITPDKALLQFSFRYLTDDHFWFTFFHEAGHLLLHEKRGLFLEGIENSLTTEEEEANKFAAHTLIPPEYEPDFLKLTLNGREVIRFAVMIGISAGIVVGQLQHFKKIGRNQLNGLKRHFIWNDSL
jgi:HTH-type transcriptional regulator / antitoxin HigA